jgi:hypothetical protein
VRDLRHPMSGCGGKARLGALPDQAAFDFRQRSKHVQKQAGPCAVVVSRASVRLRNPMPLTRRFSIVSINCFIERAKRSSFHTISVSPLRANSSASR